jgi:hypothetical protein
MPGIRLTLWTGPTVAVPAPVTLMEAIESVEVTHGDEGRSGFQLSFGMKRSGPTDLIDQPLLSLPLLQPFHRVVLLVTLGFVPQVLMDGIITHRELSGGGAGGGSTLVVTGEDVSVQMDLVERSVEHPTQDETVIATKIIGTYPELGLIPMVIPPPSLDVPLPIERTPVQQGTDLEYLREMATRYGYVFYVAPGPAPLTNTAYWGPPVRAGFPQQALSMDMGPDTNVDRLSFRTNALAPVAVSGNVLDPMTGMAVTLPPVIRIPGALAASPMLPQRQVKLRTSGASLTSALARALGTANSADDAVTAEGEIDAYRYGDVLQARGVVGVRGAGLTHDGLYYVKRVTHSIAPGRYQQRFTLTRDGTVATTPAVRA